MPKRGRPSSYNTKLATELCERIAHSDYGLEEVCAADDMPSIRAIYRWLHDGNNEEFRQLYARAKELQGHLLAGRGMRAALTAEDAAMGRLRLDAYKWHAAHLAPKVWGDKQQVEHSGALTLEGLIDQSAKPEEK